MVIKSLLKAGANIDCVNAEGHSPVELALSRSNNYIKHLLKEEQFERGFGKPGFVQRINNDPVGVFI